MGFAHRTVRRDKIRTVFENVVVVAKHSSADVMIAVVG